MCHNQTLVANRAIALADVEEIHAITVVVQVHIDGLAVGGDALHQGAHHIVNRYALNSIVGLNAHLVVCGVGIKLG